MLIHDVKIKAVDIKKSKVTFEALRAENINVMQKEDIKRIT